MEYKPRIVRMRANDPAAPPYASDMATSAWVYLAYDGDRYVTGCVAPTAGGARRLYAAALNRFYKERNALSA